MKLSDFDYKFPKERVAIYPPEKRGSSNLLVLNKKSGNLEHRKYYDLVDYFNKGDVLVLNNTKVIKARIVAKKPTGGKAELILIEKHKDFTNKVLFRGHFKVGDKLYIDDHEITFEEFLGEGIAKVRSDLNLLELAEKYGEVPIPPYMSRKSEKIDEERYQTVFADTKGSVAAPTASLNFTEEINQKLQDKGVKICYLTLHVGLGTFLPIRTDKVEEHEMHKEYFVIPKETVEILRQAHLDGKVITALGTTVTRTLEYSYNQILDENIHQDLEGEADIFIYPGYEFKIVSQLITNFHAPKSTVLMLAAAFAGWDNLKNAYNKAVEKEYMLLSYGDSMLIT